MSDPLTNPTPLPTPGQTPNWGRQLLRGIVDRTDPLRQLVTQGRLAPDVLEATIANTVEAKAGNVPIFGTQTEALAWEEDHPGQVALWFDAGYQEVTATGPTWVDNPLGGGTWSTPTEPGVIYTPAAGTAEPGQIVTVTATARPGYALLGDRSWTHTFPTPVTSFLTDFTTDPVGELPVGWTERWVIPPDLGWKVENVPDATGGRALVNRASVVARRGLSWDVLDGTTDAEVVFKWNASVANYPARALLRGDGPAAQETGYYGAIRNASTQALGMFVNGVNTLPLGPQTAFTQVPDTWYISRFRVRGDQLFAKTWLADQPEPAGWTLTTTDTSIPGPGWVGLYMVGSPVFRVDWFGVSLDDEPAPKGPAA